VSIIALLCLGHRGLVSKRKSTCPQEYYPVTWSYMLDVGDHDGRDSGRGEER
jgi:hypothetical protein